MKGLVKKMCDNINRLSAADKAGGTAPRPPSRGGGRPGQGPHPEHRGVFLLRNNFNTSYDAALICLCG